MKTYKSKRWKLLGTIVFIYLAVGVFLYLAQDKIIFHPEPLASNHHFHFQQPFKEINLKTADGNNLNIVQFFPTQKAKGILLYFHGNKDNIERYGLLAPYFTKNKYEVWMIDYPGYGKTTGKRNEQRLYDDALLFYQLAIKKSSTDSIIIYGKSLGTGVAAYLASLKPCKQLILETPYYNMRSMVRSYAPLYPAMLAKYSFPINEYLQKVNAPITIFHGTMDEVIPYKQSKKLKDELPEINLITVPGAFHNNLYAFPEVIQRLDSLLAA